MTGRARARLASSRVARLLLALLPAAAVVVIFAPTLQFDFVDFDDFGYVVENPWVSAGLDRETIVWALTTRHLGYWAPLTWLSHMLDVELFGLDPAGHHAVNVALHAGNATLAYLVLAALLRSRAIALWGALAFALHPLQVESVAWVTERKNVLAGGFWLLAVLAHVAWVRRGRRRDQVLTALAMAAGLSAKATLVTLPFALLLLDLWPLGRLRDAGGDWIARPFPWRRGFALVREKVVLFLLAAGSSVLTWSAQAEAGAVAAAFPLSQRFAHALVSYFRYLSHAFWPEGLSPLYPHPALIGLPGWGSGELALAVLVLAGSCGIVLQQARRRPWLLVGWAWFLGVLVPVIGLVQAGEQALADRHVYLPLLGLVLVLGEAARRTGWRTPIVVLGVASVLALGAASRAQLAHWRDTLALFERALAVTEDNWIAMNNVAWLRATCPDPAVRAGGRATALAERAVELTLGQEPTVLDTLAASYTESGRIDDALAASDRAIAQASRLGDATLLATLQERRAAYQRGEPIRDPRGCPPSAR